MSKLLYILCGVMLSVIGYGQYSLSGFVTDCKGNPIDEASVFCHHSAHLELSDTDGTFRLKDLPVGEYQLTFFSENHATLDTFIVVNGNTDCRIVLQDLAIALTEVEISAKRKELFATTQLKDIEGTAIYAGKKTEVVVLENIKGNLAKNVSRQVYAQVSGLNIYEGNDGGIQLGIGGRGLDPNRTSNFNTRQNGYDISADVLGYPESYYTPPADMVEQIQVIRGAASLQYGTQFGGLLNFKLKQIPKYQRLAISTAQTVGSFGFFNSSNYVGYNKGRFAADVHYNYKRGDGYRANSQYKANNLIATLRYQLSKHTELKAEMTYFHYLAKQAGGLTDSQFAENPRLSTRDRNWFHVNWLLANVVVKHKFSENTSLKVSLAGLDASRKSLGYRGNPANLNENPILAIDEQDANGNYRLARDLIRGRFRNASVETRLLHRFEVGKRKTALLVGAKYYHADNTSRQGAGSNGVDADFGSYAMQYPDYPSQSDYTFPNRNLAVFAEHIYYLNDKLSITPGCRYEYIETKASGQYQNVVFDLAGNPIANETFEENRDLGRSLVLLGVGLSYKPKDVLQLTANVSQNYRSVTFSDIRVVSPTFVVDEDIKDEKGYTADIGVKGRYNNFLSYDVGLFNIMYSDRIGIILNNRAQRVRKNIGDAVIFGVESLVDVDISRWCLSDASKLKLGIFANTALTKAEYISSQANNVKGKSVEFVPMLNLKSGIRAGYNTTNLTLQMAYLTKQYTDAQNSEIAQPGSLRDGIVGPIPAYMVWDISVETKFKQFTLSTGINNLFNEAYFTRRATGYPGPGIIPSDGRNFFVTLKYGLER